jgi:hypothetical protein
MTVESFLLIALMLVPLVRVPGWNIGRTSGKRVVLYLLAGVVGLIWTWGSGPSLTLRDLPIAALLLYSLGSMAWAKRYQSTLRANLQLGAFLVFYVAARSANPEHVLGVLSLVGPIGLVIALWLVRERDVAWAKEHAFIALEDHAGIIYKCTKLFKLHKSLGTMGNASAASVTFMIGTLAALHLGLWGLVGINFLGLIICGSKGALLGTGVGGFAYAFLS